jgi:hypothetical protein
MYRCISYVAVAAACLLGADVASAQWDDPPASA